MKIANKAPLYVLIVSLITTVICAYYNYASNARLVEMSSNNALEQLSSIITNQMETAIHNAEAKGNLIASLPIIQQLFRAGDRNGLINQLEPAILTQRSKFGVNDAEFQVAPAIAFLRMFDTGRFGDDISSYRQLVLSSIKKQQTQLGLEVGRRGPSLRADTVIKDKEGTIGAFEFGINLTSIAPEIKNLTGAEVGIFIDEELMNRVAKSAPTVGLDKIIGEFRNIYATDWQLINKVITPSQLNQLKGISYKNIIVDNVHYGIVILPLLDFKGAEIGSIVAALDFNSFYVQLNAAIVNSVAFGLLQAVILFAIILIVFRGFLLRPISYLNKQLGEALAGKDEPTKGNLQNINDEIGELSLTIYKVKTRLLAKSDQNVSISSSDMSKPV